MKLKKYLIPILGISLCLTPFILSPFYWSNNTIDDTTILSLPSIKKPQIHKELNFTDYWKRLPINFKLEKQNLVHQISHIVETYRLDEWDDYYQNKIVNKHPLGSTMVIKNAEYSVSYKKTIYGPAALHTNDIVPKLQIGGAESINTFEKITNNYLKQDVQYRYFNDFLFMFSFSDRKVDMVDKRNEGDDLLYLRWLYYSLHSAKASNERILLTTGYKKIRDIALSDWMTAIASAFYGNTEDIKSIIKGFSEYYGFNLMLNEEFQIEGKKPFTFYPVATLTCAMDLFMRGSSKPQFEIERYPDWKPKLKRINKIFNVSVNEHWNLLENSFVDTGDNSWSDDLPEDELGEIMNMFDGIKSQISAVKTNLIKLLSISVKTPTKKGGEDV